MKLEMVAVYDRAVESYGRPVFVTHTGEAVRGFIDERDNKDSQVGKHPEDFSLFHLGEYDDSSGRVQQFDQPKLLVAGVALKAKEVRRVS